jgi:hypothetical protein
VGLSLLWTLETGLGDDWSKDAETAWTNACQLLADTMIEGAAQACSTVALLEVRRFELYSVCGLVDYNDFNNRWCRHV